MKSSLIRALLLFCLALSLSFSVSAEPKDARDDFFENLKALCGQSVEGETDLIVGTANDSMAGARLLLRFATCSENEIRVPLQVDADHSRTWIIQRGENGLLLKHDHRHADGTPDEVTNYGGWAESNGTAHRQFFAADEETRKLFPHADNAGWTIMLEPDQQRLVYFVENKGEVRYRAVFDLKTARTID
ncbi:MAG: hypothetical protein WC314_16715 [Vulcanimicrobiota bacterium]